MPVPKDVAIGSWEAAALLGVHWTRPRKMADKGLIESRRLGISRGDRSAQVYSLASCERDYREYEDRVAAHGGRHERRPRAWLHLRKGMQARLAKAKVHIDYDDACSTADAMRIMRLVSTSQITRLIEAGEIVARKAHNPRQTAATGGGSVLWIISRKSCEDRQRRIIAAEAAGKKTGIRKFVKKS